MVVALDFLASDGLYGRGSVEAVVLVLALGRLKRSWPASESAEFPESSLAGNATMVRAYDYAAPFAAIEVPEGTPFGSSALRASRARAATFRGAAALA